MSRRKPKLMDLDGAEVRALIELTRTVLDAKVHEKLKAILETFLWMMAELEKKTATLRRIRKILSINTKKTEKTSDVLKATGGADAPPGGDEHSGGEKPEKKKKKKKPKGHGRNGADAYEGAQTIQVPHELLESGGLCPKCEEPGKVYKLRKPRRLVRVTGQTPMPAKLYELERLRCNLCGEVFTAKAPEGIGEDKYDPTSASMIGLLKYGSGLPFYRLEKLGKYFKIPLPASTQWDIVRKAAIVLAMIYEELIRQVAQWDIFYNDDTSVKILQLLKENQQIEQEGSKERTGIFTSAIVAVRDNHKSAVFFTGRQHAGENLEDVLRRRANELEIPIQMCDGLSRNVPKEFATILANCMTHGRRKFVEVVDSFPEECSYVLESLRQVYRHDAIARKEKMSPERRLRFHKDHSAGIMKQLKRWMKQQLAQKKVEPNSSLGAAFSYMLKRWDKLTLFLRKPGAPLDNNTCERALKKAILHRKNSLFYKTKKGARVADIFMSLIYTAELHSVDPFDYLTELLRHPEELRRKPRQWMPWNYQVAVAANEAAVLRT